MQNKSGSERSVSCLKQGSEMSNFGLKQGRGLKALAARLYLDFPWVPPPGACLSFLTTITDWLIGQTLHRREFLNKAMLGLGH